MASLLSVVTGSYNEEGNVDEWFERYCPEAGAQPTAGD